MNYRHLGRSGLRVSPLALGTMNFASNTSQEDAFAIMDRALELGINFFDTADVYGMQIEPGYTEKLIGKWLAQGGGRREKVVLATKVYGAMDEWPNHSHLSALHIRRACEASLSRLQTDYIDLYQMHHVWRAAPWEEVWQALELLVRDGKVVYTGSSNFAAWNIVQANEIARTRHFLGLVSEQSLYNLLSREIELEVLPACRATGVAVLPWSPLSGGLLGGVSKNTGARRASEKAQARAKELAEPLRAWEALCDELGHSPSSVAIAWLSHQPGVTAPIVGPRTMEQFESLVATLDIQLDETALSAIDAIFPGPGGGAPEAYAW